MSGSGWSPPCLRSPQGTPPGSAPYLAVRAGCTQTVFEDAAIEAILNAADGTPRVINKLCNASLLIGNSNNLNIINTNAVMQGINDCELG